MGLLKVFDGSRLHRVGCDDPANVRVTATGNTSVVVPSTAEIDDIGVVYLTSPDTDPSLTTSGWFLEGSYWVSWSGKLSYTRIYIKQLTSTDLGATLASSGVGADGQMIFLSLANVELYAYGSRYFDRDIQGNFGTNTSMPTGTATADDRVLRVVFTAQTSFGGTTPAFTTPSGMDLVATRAAATRHRAAVYVGSEVSPAGSYSTTVTSSQSGASANIVLLVNAAPTGRLRLWTGTEWVREACDNDVADSNDYPAAANTVTIYADNAGHMYGYANQLTGADIAKLDMNIDGGQHHFLYVSGDINGGHSLWTCPIASTWIGTSVANAYWRKANDDFVGFGNWTPSTVLAYSTPIEHHPLKMEDPANPGTWITVACMVPAPLDVTPATTVLWRHLNFGTTLYEEQPTTVYRTSAARSARLLTDTGAGAWRLALNPTVGKTYRATVWIRQVTGDGSTSARECDLEVQDMGTSAQTTLHTSITFDDTKWSRLTGTFVATNASTDLLMQGDAGHFQAGWSMFVSDWTVEQLD